MSRAETLVVVMTATRTDAPSVTTVGVLTHECARQPRTSTCSTGRFPYHSKRPVNCAIMLQHRKDVALLRRQADAQLGLERAMTIANGRTIDAAGAAAGHAAG